MKLSDFRENSEHNNRVIQYALREIDTRLLALMIYPISGNDREIIFRNMSKQGRDLLIQAVEEFHDVPEKSSKTAADFFGRKLEKYNRYLNDEADNKVSLPSLKDSNPAEILETFKNLAAYIRKRGTIGLDALLKEIRNPVLKKGLQIYLDGYDPLIAQSILENRRAAWMKEMEITGRMIVEGFDSIYAKDFSQVTEEKLRAYMVPCE